MAKETTLQRTRRLKRIKRPRLNSRRKRRARATAAMKQRVEDHKAWMESVIGRLETMREGLLQSTGIS